MAVIDDSTVNSLNGETVQNLIWLPNEGKSNGQSCLERTRARGFAAENKEMGAGSGGGMGAEIRAGKKDRRENKM